MLYSVPRILVEYYRIKYSTIYTVHYILYIVHCTLYIVYCTVYTTHYSLYIVHCIMYSTHCTLYNVHCTPYTTSILASYIEHMCYVTDIDNSSTGNSHQFNLPLTTDQCPVNHNPVLIIVKSLFDTDQWSVAILN